MDRVRTEDGLLASESGEPGREAIVSPAVDFLLLFAAVTAVGLTLALLL